MSKRTPVGLGLIAALLALGMLAFGASTASATWVVPPNTGITATNSGNTIFIPANGYTTTSVQSETSSAVFTTPTGRTTAEPEVKVGNDNNINRTGIGARSTGPGSVTADLTEPPSFTNSGIYAWNGVAWVKIESATVTTNATNGQWGIAALSTPSEDAVAVLTVPKAGAKVTAPSGLEITVSPTQVSAVTGIYTNGNSTLKVDGQIAFESNAGLESPAQFEGTYTLNNGFEIRP